MALIAPSLDTLFIRGFSTRIHIDDIRNFFSQEYGRTIITFMKETMSGGEHLLALKFQSKSTAREVLNRFNGAEVLGCRINVTWYKDIRKANPYVCDRASHRQGRPVRGAAWSAEGRYDYRSGVHRGSRGSSGAPYYGALRTGYYSRTSTSDHRPRRRLLNRSRSRSRTHSKSSTPGSPATQGSRSHSNESRDQTHKHKRSTSDSRRRNTQTRKTKTVRNIKSTERSIESPEHSIESPDHSVSSTPSDVETTSATVVHSTQRNKAKKRKATSLNRQIGEGQVQDVEQQRSKEEVLESDVEGSSEIDETNMQQHDSQKAPRVPSLKSTVTVGGHRTVAGPRTPTDEPALTDSTQLSIDTATCNTVDNQLGDEPQTQNVSSLVLTTRQQQHVDIPTTDVHRLDCVAAVDPASDAGLMAAEAELGRGAETGVRDRTNSGGASGSTVPSCGLEGEGQNQEVDELTDMEQVSNKCNNNNNKAAATAEVNAVVGPPTVVAKKKHSKRGGPSDLGVLGLSAGKMVLVREKKDDIEKAYRQDCETFATVTKMLINKDPGLEDRIQFSLRENLKDIGKRCIHELRSFIDGLRTEQDDEDCF